MPALCLDEELDGSVYHTMIYYYEGGVRELFFEAGYEFSPENGAEVLRCAPLLLQEAQNGMIQASAGGNSVYIYPRGAAAVP